eukprot:TRINITY_DN60748_c0_g1_i1.p1 TRINITY_DN60748_c0_g1~~TRINITY_DN60748_c0_g1_i1.p1  ORF type:complete len:333 (+),score=74.47 TRINITY_DN60748_c0_g1_i1:89-1000(+)
MAAVPAAAGASPLLQLANLHAQAGGRQILRGVSLTVNPGEVHAVMGPNGSGKSTLARVLCGHPDYSVTKGGALFRGEPLVTAGEEPPQAEDLSKRGLFVSPQSPPDVPGLSNREFLYTVAAAHHRERKGKDAVLSELAFERMLSDALDSLGLQGARRRRIAEGNLNEGFSGGERKVNEVAQLLVLGPHCAVLDEADSGLDVDATARVGAALRRHLAAAPRERALVVVTHYADALLRHLRPTHVHLLRGGRVVRSATGPELAQRIAKDGFDAVTPSEVLRAAAAAEAPAAPRSSGGEAARPAAG